MDYILDERLRKLTGAVLKQNKGTPNNPVSSTHFTSRPNAHRDGLFTCHDDTTANGYNYPFGQCILHN